MTFKFERLEVWQMALNYVDLVYEMAICYLDPTQAVHL